MARLTRDAWCMAALHALGEGGVRSLSVEGLAAGLGVTKGSFYWHFKNRAELLTAALALWQDQGTRAVIDRLADLASPEQRLQALFAESLSDLDLLRVEAVLMAAASHGDPLIAPVFAEVNALRLSYLEQLYRQLQVPDPRIWARMAYAAYLGGVQLAAMQPSPLQPDDAPRLVRLLQTRLMPARPTD